MESPYPNSTNTRIEVVKQFFLIDASATRWVGSKGVSAMTSQDKVLVRIKTERGAALSPVSERSDNAGSKSYYKQIIQQAKQGKEASLILDGPLH